MIRYAIGVVALASIGLVQAGPVRAQQVERSDQSPGERSWGRDREAIARTMIAHLDMTSFANSIGPRRTVGKRTLADYGFTVVHGFDDGWVDATLPDGSWQFGIFVLANGRYEKRLCVTDAAVGGGTYDRVEAVEVAPRGDGLWHVVRVIGPVTGCAGT